MSDAVVIGAGVVGASVAYRLAKAGLGVTVLESTLVGGGTSGCSFAWLNAGNKPPKAYHDLNVAGMRAHAQLADDFGETPWLHGGGHVEWYLTEAAQRSQRAKIEQLQAWGYPVEWITAADLAALEPDLNLAAVGDAPIAYFAHEGWVDAVPYAQAMMSAAVRLGAVLRIGARVERVQTARWPGEGRYHSGRRALPRRRGRQLRRALVRSRGRAGRRHHAAHADPRDAGLHPSRSAPTSNGFCAGRVSTSGRTAAVGSCCTAAMPTRPSRMARSRAPVCPSSTTSCGGWRRSCPARAAPTPRRSGRPCARSRRRPLDGRSGSRPGRLLRRRDPQRRDPVAVPQPPGSRGDCAQPDHAGACAVPPEPFPGPPDGSADARLSTSTG